MNIEAIAEAIPRFVQEHKAWAAPIVFALAFCESLAFVSLVLPFWGMLVAIGTVVGANGGGDFWTIMSAAAVGAALGDWLSYWLGYHYHRQIAGMWPLSKYPDLLPAGHRFFERWGPWAIVLGRFSGPLRASVPIVAGAVEMPVVTFQIANWVSAFIWAATLMLFGDAISKVWFLAKTHFFG